MRKILLFLAVFIFLSANVSAEDIKIYYNNKEVKSDVSPVIKNGRTMVPLRVIGEMLGAEVDWDDKGRKATVKIGDRLLNFFENIPQIVIAKGADVETNPIDFAPFIKDGRIMLPVRVISETFDKVVGYDDKTRSVLINDREIDLISKFIPSYPGIGDKVKDIAKLGVNKILPEKYNDELKSEIEKLKKSHPGDYILYAVGEVGNEKGFLTICYVDVKNNKVFAYTKDGTIELKEGEKIEKKVEENTENAKKDKKPETELQLTEKTAGSFVVYMIENSNLELAGGKLSIKEVKKVEKDPNFEGINGFYIVLNITKKGEEKPALFGNFFVSEDGKFFAIESPDKKSFKTLYDRR